MPPPVEELLLTKDQRRFSLGLLIGVVAIVWFGWELKMDELLETLRSVQFEWVALAALILVAEFGIRALRWSVLLKPMGYDIPIKLLFSAQVIGAALNTILPLRAGEVAKPLLVSQKSGHPFWAVTATAIMERVFDILGMVSVLVVMLFFLDARPETDSANLIRVQNLQRYGGFLGIFALACMGIFFALTTQRERARPIFELIVRPTPRPVQNLFLSLYDGFVIGLSAIQSPKSVVLSALLSIVMWLNGALAIFVLFQAFSLPLGFGAACFTAVAIAISVALPQAPGFIGVFHVAIEETLILWGMSLGPAKGFALVFWAISFIPVTLLGVIRLWREGLDWNSIKSVQARNFTQNEQ